jgi:hypothetical protein
MMIKYIEYIELGFDENNMMAVEKLILERISSMNIMNYS